MKKPDSDEILNKSLIPIKNPINKEAKWINNDGVEVKNVFGFDKNAELVNGRAAMFGFLMMIITEIIFRGEPVTHSIFGIG
tara:strand:- start:505 stop:747 length:243 start_codon:yes stop_codon:yes gene_type:complete